MALYAMLSKLTDDGWKTIRGNPDRIAQVNKEIEEMGGKVVSQFAALGPFDFINIVEAADNLTVANISVQLGSRGTVQIQTIPLIDVDTFIKKIASG